MQFNYHCYQSIGVPRDLCPTIIVSLVQEQSGFRREEEALHVLAGKLSIDGKRNHEEGKLNMCTNSWKTKRKRNKTSHMPGFINFALPVPVDLCTRWGKRATRNLGA